MFTANIVLNCRINIETADTNGLKCNNAAKTDHCCFCSSAANVNHHVPDRFINRKIGTNCCRHRLFNQLRVRCTSASCRVCDCSAFYFRNCRRHADNDFGASKSRHTDTLQKQANHAFCDVKVGDCSTAQRTHGHDVTRRTPDHVPRLMTSGKHFTGLTINGNHGRFIQNYAATLHVHQRVRCAKVNCEVTCH